MDLDQLHQLNALKYQRSQQELAVILKREDVLRAELAKLRGFVIETRSLPAEQSQMRAIGADVIWLRWVTKAQARLNIELAQVLARKEGYLAQHKRAFGKVQVSEALAENEREKLAAERRQAALERAVQQSLF